MIEYPIGKSGQVLVLNSSVVEHLYQHRQLHRSQSEAGGQLFARFDENSIMVVEATGPRVNDQRTPTTYVADRVVEQLEIFSALTTS